MAPPVGLEPTISRADAFGLLLEEAFASSESRILLIQV